MKPGSSRWDFLAASYLCLLFRSNNSLQPKQQRDKKTKCLKGVNYASFVFETKNELKLSQNALSHSSYSGNHLLLACVW